MSSLQNASAALQQGKLVLVTDDYNENVSYLTGRLPCADIWNVNFMTKKGKGLVYACIDQSKADTLQLQTIGEGGEDKKNFTVSVDYYTVTTGISVSERTDTLQALHHKHSVPTSFIRPGHVFPLIYTGEGLLNHRNIAEAASDLLRLGGDALPDAYLCEILNDTGDIARIPEIKEMARHYQMEHVYVSDLLAAKEEEQLTSFNGFASPIPYVNKALAFPNTNVFIEHDDPVLPRGVYGICVQTADGHRRGIMHVNEPEPPSGGNMYDICLLETLEPVKEQDITVDVLFYLRDLRVFASSSIDELVHRYQKDYKNALRLFDLLQSGKGGMNDVC